MDSPSNFRPRRDQSNFSFESVRDYFWDSLKTLVSDRIMPLLPVPASASGQGSSSASASAYKDKAAPRMNPSAAPLMFLPYRSKARAWQRVLQLAPFVLVLGFFAFVFSHFVYRSAPKRETLNRASDIYTEEAFLSTYGLTKQDLAGLLPAPRQLGQEKASLVMLVRYVLLLY